MLHFNSQQLAAIQYMDGPLLVIAGAGSGKTRVITHKIEYLIQQGLKPNHIYALTFTNKAAKEMQTRVQKLLKTKSKREDIHISTFHSLGLNILKKEASHLQLNPHFTLFDELDGINLLKELSVELTPLSEENIKFVHQMIANWKNELISPQQALEASQDENTHLAARFFVFYEKTLRAYNAVDFDDLIALPVKLFQENRLALERWQNKIHYLLVDEYQDTNSAQYQLIKLLCQMRNALTIVGDDDQSIYAWRGARPENIQLLQQDFLNLKVIKLEQNYRSTSTILQAANHLISYNPHLFNKKLWSTLGVGEPIRIITTSDQEAEIERVVNELIAHKFRHHLAFRDYAILYRSNHQARNLEQLLRLQGIPYQISGGLSFFSRSEIKDLFAYFRLIVNPQDDAAFLRCINTPRRDIGPTTLEKLGLYAKQRQISLFHACSELGLSAWLAQAPCKRLHHFSEHILRLKEALNSDGCLDTIAAFIETIGYFQFIAQQAPTPQSAQKRINNVQSLLTWLGRLTNSPDTPLSFEEAIQKMMLIDLLDQQSSSQPTDAVQLMTLHAAKGLEFPHVFILGWEEETLPHKTSIALDLIHEERRLAYVGMTRAQKTLTLTCAKQRKRFGEWEPITPSRFLFELPTDLIDWEGQCAPDPQQQQAKIQAHFTQLKALLQK